MSEMTQIISKIDDLIRAFCEIQRKSIEVEHLIGEKKQLRALLFETVIVLENSRKSFKSLQLETLRKNIMEVLSSTE